MSDYRRHRVPGGCYFFTVNLLERRGNTLLTDRIDLLREAVRRVRRSRPFSIDAWVVLPDHLHAVWTLPPGDDDFSTRWRLIKSFFVRDLPKTERLSRVRRDDGERGIWQRRFWEHAIRDDEDYGAHVDYIHFNPVKHGLVAAPAEWPYSTFKACVHRGLYPLGWIGSGVQDLSAGEPGRR
jgi:REP-associated tyrosine transposase